MKLLATLSTLKRICQEIDLGKSHGSCGVAPFKLRKDYFLEPAGKAHDKAYKTIDWKKGSFEVDRQFLADAMLLASTPKQQEEALLCYRIARSWGKMRYGLNRIGISW